MRNHKCHTCNKAFGQAATLQTHINNVHLQIKKYKCQECAKCFKNTTALKYHIKTKHEGIREVHKCKQCPKQFTHSQTLRYHANFSHKGITKFRCDKCQKYFPSPGYVKTHKKKIHEGEKFPCDHCDKKFTQKPNLKRHLVKNHQIDLFKCSFCGMTFIYEDEMDNHNVKNHMVKTEISEEQVDDESDTKVTLELNPQDFTQPNSSPKSEDPENIIGKYSTLFNTVRVEITEFIDCHSDFT